MNPMEPDKKKETYLLVCWHGGVIDAGRWILSVARDTRAIETPDKMRRRVSDIGQH